MAWRVPDSVHTICKGFSSLRILGRRLWVSHRDSIIQPGVGPQRGPTPGHPSKISPTPTGLNQLQSLLCAVVPQEITSPCKTFHPPNEATSLERGRVRPRTAAPAPQPLRPNTGELSLRAEFEVATKLSPTFGGQPDHEEVHRVRAGVGQHPSLAPSPLRHQPAQCVILVGSSSSWSFANVAALSRCGGRVLPPCAGPQISDNPAASNALCPPDPAPPGCRRSGGSNFPSFQTCPQGWSTSLRRRGRAETRAAHPQRIEQTRLNQLLPCFAGDSLHHRPGHDVARVAAPNTSLPIPPPEPGGSPRPDIAAAARSPGPSDSHRCCRWPERPTGGSTKVRASPPGNPCPFAARFGKISASVWLQ